MLVAGGVARVVVIADGGTPQRERTGQGAGTGNAGVEGIGRQIAGACSQDIQIGRIDVLFDAGFRDGPERRRRISCRRRGARRVGLRHHVGRAVRKFRDLRSADVIGRLTSHRELLRQCEVRARRSVLVDNTLGQQVGDRLPFALRPVHTEGVIETAILADQDDDMVDRACGACIVVIVVIVIVVIAIVVIVVVIVAVVLTAVVMRIVLTLVPATPAPFSTITRGNNRQRRYDT